MGAAQYHCDSLNGVVCKSLPIYFCPSDRRAPAFQQGDQFWRSRGSYAINWGPIRQPHPGCPVTLPSGNAPFGFRNHCTRSQPDIIGFGEIVDGLSNTLMMSEVIMHEDRSRTGVVICSTTMINAGDL